MAVTIRLSRKGRKKNPDYRVVVADSRHKRDGRVIETIGHYHPRQAEGPVTFDRERFEYWVSKGARPSPTVAQLWRREKKAASTPTG